MSRPSSRSPARSSSGRRLWKGAALYFNPEVAGGSGLSGARGVAGFPNGETFRIGDPAPNLYLARLYLRQTFALGPDTDVDEDDLNQLAGPRPKHYFALNLGKFSVADFFDQNSYSHDPRTQFLNWSLMSAGAWGLRRQHPRLHRGRGARNT